MLRHRLVSRMSQKTPEMHEQSRLSGYFHSCLFLFFSPFYFLNFFIIQYFLINEGISVTTDIKKVGVGGGGALKCLFRSTDMHEIDHTFPFLSLLFFFKVIWRRGGGGGGVLH